MEWNRSTEHEVRTKEGKKVPDPSRHAQSRRSVAARNRLCDRQGADGSTRIGLLNTQSRRFQ